MQIKDVVRKYNTRKEVIIKRKKEIFDISIKCGMPFKHDVHIYIDSEKLCVDNKEIKICDLKTIYIWGLHHRGIYSCSIEFQQNGLIPKGISLTITGISDEDVIKIKELFEYFIFSNEKDIKKLTSNLYTSINENTSELNDISAKEYASTDIINTKKALIELNNEYYLYEILPKEYLKKYSKIKDFLIYRSKFVNDNYIEIWGKNENFSNDFFKKNLHLYIKFVLFILLFLIVFIGLFVSFYNIEIIKYCNNSNIFLYFLVTMIPNIILMITFIIIGIINSKKKKMLKTILIGFILSALFIGMFDIFYMPTNYDEIVIKGNRVSMLNYKCAILKDMIQGKTTTIVTPNVICYRYRGDYIAYFGEQKQDKYCSKENSKLVKIVQELIKYEEEVKIEYYNNTGIIKSIDEIDKNDYEKLLERVKLLSDNQPYKTEQKITSITS